MSESTSFTSTGQTREAAAQWAVLRSRKRLEFVSAKRAASPLQGRAATIERTEHWFESNCHHHSEALADQGLPLFYPPASLPRGSLFSGFTSAT